MDRSRFKWSKDRVFEVMGTSNCGEFGIYEVIHNKIGTVYFIFKISGLCEFIELKLASKSSRYSDFESDLGLVLCAPPNTYNLLQSLLPPASLMKKIIQHIYNPVLPIQKALNYYVITEFLHYGWLQLNNGKFPGKDVSDNIVTEAVYKYADEGKTDISCYGSDDGEPSVSLFKHFLSNRVLPSTDGVFGTNVGHLTVCYLSNFGYEMKFVSPIECQKKNEYPFCIGLAVEALVTMNAYKESNDKTIIFNTFSSYSYKDLDDILKKLDNTLDKIVLFEKVPDNIQELYKDIIPAQWDLTKRIFEEMLNVLKKRPQKLIFVHDRIHCDHEENGIAFTQVPVEQGKEIPSIIAFCNDFFNKQDLPNKDHSTTSKFHTVVHELSHVVGTIDATAGDKKAYGQKRCKQWAESHNEEPLTDIGDINADCIAILLSTYFEFNSPISSHRDFQTQSIYGDKMKAEMNIIFNMNVHANPQRVVTWTLTLNNNSPHDYFINPDAIFLYGIRGKSFYISGPAPVNCLINTFHYVTKSPTLLESMKSIVSSVTLSDICEFSELPAGTYTVHYHQRPYLFTNDTVHFFSDDNFSPAFYAILYGKSNFVLVDESRPLSGLDSSTSSEEPSSYF